MRQLRFTLAAPVITALVTGSLSAAPITLDFEQFDVGDGLAEVNAVTAPLGITFDAANPASFAVSDVGGNKFLRADPGGASGVAGIVLNFNADVDFVEAAFIDNPFKFGGVSNVTSQIDTWDATQNPAALNIANFLLGDFAFVDPATLNLRFSDVFFTPASPRFRALSIEQSGTQTAFLAVDDILIEFVESSTVVPEPTSAWLLAVGLVGLCAGSRRRRTRSSGV